ncbi:cation diffusion facilitator family transporter [Planktosalinus lacus]|uniref:Cobalt transporter n=1 Tax=Planktosalinus lacus TaxID=1526573 RepID=A0A8J2V7U6_9FLAO|nr:cation diffusion facilitator family transporter [Planktosalinus lacus]GGD80334.1 cobalt transporter [Planktosalinus lacus]
MEHGHHHPKSSQVKGNKVLFSIILNLILTVAQLIGGIVSGSLALISDTLHNFSDVVSLSISYIANKLIRKEASYKRTFGYKRAEIMAAFINSATIVIVAIYLIYEAIHRFIEPQEIGSDIVIWMALLGIFVDGFSMLLLKKDSDKNMNMKSAYLHMLSDLASSVAVLIGGLLMKFYEIWWIDGVLTLIIAFYLIRVGYLLLKKSFNVLMLFTPDEVRVEEITKKVNALPGIKSIHHIHIWQLNEDEVHLEAHLEFNKNVKISEFDRLLLDLEELLLYDFGINHITIQPEFQREESSKDIIVQD